MVLCRRGNRVAHNSRPYGAFCRQIHRFAQSACGLPPAASAAMFGAWVYASSHPKMEFAPFFLIYPGFLAFYMPTLALANTTTFALLKSRGQMPVDHFPVIRIWGHTSGFVVAMWFVNSAYYFNHDFGFTLSDSHPASGFRFQYTSMQLLASKA